jgi:AP-3 complex subunit beta
MSSTVWQNPIGGSLTGAGGMVTGESSMAENRLNSQLASALSTMGSDSQFFEDSISPSSIRTNLSASDPSNPSSIPTLTRGMKWLLASLSKGRDVSDFYPHVVKLVGVPSLEVRKLVYMYLVHYADHDASTRELSLLSINSFQRGLADHEQLIRALALRVLSSIRVPDILQIQILACRKCATDDSPYVRKCAANALAKLYGQCTDIHMSDSLLAIMQTLLEKDSSTMVLTSAIIAFNELCPDRLDLLHGAFRKICHLLTDMDEWGQVVVIDTMARYCRRFFKEPHAMKHGSAELIDKSRRIVRTTTSTPNNDTSWALDTLPSQPKSIGELKKTPALPERVEARKVKRRVVKKAFYSDEEDESEEEEVEIGSSRRTIIFGGGHGGGSTNGENTAPSWNNNFGGPASAATQDTEDEDIDEDHKLLLKASFPLLKSRNSGVVLAVCSLHYYCGVSNISTRSAMGKAMVRIHRDRREIQYVVLTSIRSLVRECPSAFTPYLNDFFVKVCTCINTSPVITVLACLSCVSFFENAMFACSSLSCII